MINEREIQEGWALAEQLEGGQLAAVVGENYISAILAAIEKTEKDINSYAGSKQNPAQLSGFIAEEWHANTFNINSVVADSSHRAIVEESREHASVDVSTNFGQEYSLKYLKYPDRSVAAQSKNVIQNYHEYLSQAKARGTKHPLSFEQYLEKYDYSDSIEEILQSVYRGQGRIIPSDQLDAGIKKLRQMIATESARGGEHRLLNLKNYEETLCALSDRIKDGAGVESNPLTKAEAEAIATLCKSGDFRLSDFGITIDKLVIKQYILNKALQGGLTAATVTLAIQLVPEIIKLLDRLLHDGSISLRQLKDGGIRGVSAGAKSFIIGFLACGLHTACRSGKLGVGLKSINPGTLGTIVALTFSVISDSFDYSCGKIGADELGVRITKSAIISASSLAGGAIATTLLPLANAISFTIGSIVGSVVASISISAAEQIVVSFCCETGFTLFGLVTQDYTLPDFVISELGLKIASLNQIKTTEASLRVASLKQATITSARLNYSNITVLRRGVVAFNRVAYI